MKYLSLVFICLSLLVLGGCQSPTSSSSQSNLQLRYQYLLSNGGQPTQLNYGVRCGDAEYDGALTYGTYSPYESMTPGAYVVQFKESNGQWATVSESSADFTGKSGKWTMTILGDISSFSFRWAQDPN